MISWIISLKHAFPGLWNKIESANGALFKIRWRNIEHISSETIKDYAPEGFVFSLIGQDDIPALSEFLETQPEDSFQYFRPHLFDTGTLGRLWRNKSFLMMKVTDTEGKMAGYFFLRCFSSVWLSPVLSWTRTFRTWDSAGAFGLRACASATWHICGCSPRSPLPTCHP